MCRFASLFLLQRLKEASQATRAISKHRDASSHQVFFFLHGNAPNEIHAILTETLAEYAPSYATLENCLTPFKRGDFSTCDAPRPGRTKT